MDISEFTIIGRVFNIYHPIHSARSPVNEYLLRDRCIQNPVNDVKWSALEK